MLDFDMTELLHDKLAGDRRPPDGKLHPSGDLIGSLRHAQLRAAGAPTVASELVGDVRLMTGTMWHSYFEQLFTGKPVMLEVQLDPWLPEGWSGRADWIFWSDEYQAFVLGDLKTIRGEGLPYVQRDGMKTEHRWQLSAYWHALNKMGVPLVRGIAVYYLPMNIPADNPGIMPVYLEADPVPEAEIIPVMEERWEKTEAYLRAVQKAQGHGPTILDEYLQPELAPVQDRVQAIRRNKKTNVWDVKLVPHWSAQFCPFPDELCDCSTQGTTKIGHYTDDGEYVARAGYEAIVPTVHPK